MKNILLLIILSLATGCAAIKPNPPHLQNEGVPADFRGNGATVRIEYALDLKAASDGTQGAMGRGSSAQRSEELMDLFVKRGFRRAEGQQAAFVVNVKETYDYTNEKFLPGFLTTITMGVFHWPVELGTVLDYSLIRNGKPESTIRTKASSMGIMGISSLAIAPFTKKTSHKTALLKAHESVLAEWIEAGAFE